jgi:hypothetical protein
VQELKECQCDACTLRIAGRTHTSIIACMTKDADPANQAILEFLAKHGELKLKEVKQ